MPDSSTPRPPAPRYRFAWREGNRFDLLCDGSRFFPAMLEAIAAATSSIYLEMYLFESGAVANRFIDALIAAARRNVHTCVLLDDFGAGALHSDDRARLTDNGVLLGLYNPLRYGQLRRYLFRDHRKLLVVDHSVAFTGGAGITDAFHRPGPPELSWRETMVAIRGPVIADWRALFEQNWARWASQPADTAALAGPVHSRGEQLGRLACSGGLARADIKRSFLKRTRNAERRVWMATAYFVPSWKLLRALQRAARGGTDVRLLLPGPLTDHPGIRHAGRRFYGRLLRNGVRVFEYQPRFMHSKVLLCDNWVSIGSSNVDRWNLRWNLEANQEIDDADFAERTCAMLEIDFRDCHEFHFESWRHRPWYRRLLERFYGAIDVWMERRSNRRTRKHP